MLAPKLARSSEGFYTLERYRLLLAKLVARIDLGLGAACFPNEDGSVWVVLLHGGIRLCEEQTSARAGVGSRTRAGVPRRSAVLARLAEEEAQLLQLLRKAVLGGHGARACRVCVVCVGVCVEWAIALD